MIFFSTFGGRSTEVEDTELECAYTEPTLEPTLVESNSLPSGAILPSEKSAAVAAGLVGAAVCSSFVSSGSGDLDRALNDLNLSGEHIFIIASIFPYIAPETSGMRVNPNLV